MKTMLVAMVLVAGCSDRPIEGATVTTEPPPVVYDDWVHFPTFSIQRHAQAPGLTWEQAQASCEAMDASLPTEWQWLAAAPRGASGLVPSKEMDAPTFEWWFYQPGTVSYLEGTSFYFQPPKGEPSFRCARGDQYPH
jgi:hypothetical protein